MGNVKGLPFVEIVERVANLARIDSENDKPKVRGVIENLYLREIPRKYDWTFLLSSTSLFLNGQYNTGTVSATTGGTTLNFSGATLAASMNKRKIKISGNDYVYEFTFTNTSTGTVEPAIYGDSNPSGASYTIFDPDYSLPSDFDRFPKGGGLIYSSGGSKTQIPEEAIQEYYTNYAYSPSIPEACHITGYDTAGNLKIEVRPAPSKDLSVGLDYIKQLRPLKITTSGVIDTIASGGTTVTGSAGTTKFTEATTGDYLRIDALGVGPDSKWYRIATITHNSSLTLSSAFALTGVNSCNYTICSMPEYPEKMHDALIWGALRTLTGDQNDPMFQFYNIQLGEVLTDGKRLYVTRVPNQVIDSIATDYQYRR